MTTDECIEALTWYRDHKNVEWFNGLSWFPLPGNKLEHLLLLLSRNTSIRVKPTPKLRPMRHDEFPAVWWFKSSDSLAWRLVVEIIDSASFVLCNGDHYFFDEPNQDKSTWQWSPDRKEIRSFFVEDKE